MFPVKLVYLISLAILELGSVVCASAPNSIAFILLVLDFIVEACRRIMKY